MIKVFDMPRIRLATLLALLALTGCGGGATGSGGSGGNSTNPPPTPPPPAPPPTLVLSASTDQTLAGGKAVTLNSSTDSSAAPTWSLASGSVGSLSATSGASVTYTPPATVAVNTPVTITATVGSVSKTQVLTVFPEPGAPGLSIIAGRLNPDVPFQDAVDGPAASARFRDSLAVAADLAGNVYVMGTCEIRMSLFGGLVLRKIGTDGVVSTLASCYDNNWFGKPDTGGNFVKFDTPQGLAVDRAGNLYTGNAIRIALAVYKISPQGMVIPLAGSAVPSESPVDGIGDAARFLWPDVVGIDSDDNLYAYDQVGNVGNPSQRVVRKITPAGAVTTVAALPASLGADLNGNTYSINAGDGAVIMTTPAGTVSTIANIFTLPGMVPESAKPYVAGRVVRSGPATYVFAVSNGRSFSNEVIVKLVVPH
jgi:hypothetical protein